MFLLRFLVELAELGNSQALLRIENEIPSRQELLCDL